MKGVFVRVKLFITRRGCAASNKPFKVFDAGGIVHSFCIVASADGAQEDLQAIAQLYNCIWERADATTGASPQAGDAAIPTLGNNNRKFIY
jgi:hypothetical protein